MPKNTKWPRALRALESSDYRNLWIGTQLLMTGMHVQMMARSFLVYDITGSGKILAIVSAAQAAPVLFLSPFGGVIADRIERRRLVSVFQTVTAITAFVVAVSITLDTITWIYLMLSALVYGVTFSFAMPARNALIPSMVGPNRISSAVALNAAGISAQSLIAPGLGGVLYAMIGPDGAYYFGAAVAVLALAFTSLIRKNEQPRQVAKTPITSDMWSGLMYVRRNEVLVAVMVMVIMMLILVQPLPFLLPIMVVEVYQRDSGTFGLLLSALGFGSLVGSICIAMINRGRPGLILVGGAAIAGLAMLAMVMFPIYLAGIALLAGVGLSDAARRTLVNKIIMEQVDDEYLGRVMSIYYMCAGLLPGSLVLSGLCSDVLGSQFTIGMMGVLLIICSLVMLITQKSLRNLR